MRVLGWKAWYPDVIYSSKDTAWKDLPARGLQVTMLYFDDGSRRVITNSHVVRWVDDMGAPHWEEYEHSDIPEGTADMVWGPTAVEKHGALLPDEQFTAILERAMNDWQVP